MAPQGRIIEHCPKSLRVQVGSGLTGECSGPFKILAWSRKARFMRSGCADPKRNFLSSILYKMFAPAPHSAVGFALALTLLVSPCSATQFAVNEAIRAIVARGELTALHWKYFSDRRDELKQFYGLAGYAPAWFNEGSPSKQAYEATDLLAGAEAEGLEPGDYDISWLQSRLATAAKTPLSVVEQAETDTALTLALFRYLIDLHRGKINPRSLGWVLDGAPRRNYNVAQVLRGGIARDALASIAVEAEPRLLLYRRLKATLAVYRRLAQDISLQPVPTLKTKLEPGRPYGGAATLARLLTAIGDLPANAPVSVDRYDGALPEAVKRFQERHGLAVDGVLGKATFAELNVPLTGRVRQIELAMERLRWLPDLTAGPVIAINVPSFRLWAFSHLERPGEADIETKVIVGRAVNTRTPIFMQDMRFVEFSPYWNVPPSILRKEMIPKLRRDPRYLAREDYEFVGQDGRTSTEVSENTLAAALAGELRLRQRPGPKNALGGVKFVLPNSMNIYLHSTPFRNLFELPRRDFSHGCIRVADAVGLAHFVLSDQTVWTEARIEEAMASGQLQTAKLSRPIPVVIFYTTVVIQRNGEVLFEPDIYRNDVKLEQALAAATRARR